MFSVCKEHHAATAVEHAVACNFFNKSEKSLLVAGTRFLKVFRLIPNIESGVGSLQSDTRPPKMKLECVCEFSLHSNIMSMQSIGFPNLERDALLLSFRDAKLSIVDYDPDNHDLRTLSLHYFEEEDLKNGWTQNQQIPIVRVDPENRCAIMLLYGRKIAIFPFKRESSLDEMEATDLKPMVESKGTNKQPILSSYVMSLNDLSEKVDNVIDMQFLHGYYEPTLLILFEPLKTYSGRVAVRNDTCSIIAISINAQQKVQPVIWSLNNLPFDCTQAIPVQKPMGGVIIFSVNAFIYLNQSVPPFGMALNSMAETTTHFPLKSHGDLNLTLDCAQATFVLEDTLVISLKSGDLYVLTLIADSMRSIRSFHFDKVAASVLTTCISAYEDNFIFLGSRLGNSLLLRFVERENEPINSINMSEEEQTNLNRILEADPMEVTEDLVEKTLYDCVATDVLNIRDVDEFEVYGDVRPPSLQIKRYIFEVCDSLINIGPCGNATIGESAFLSDEFSHNCDYDLEIVTTSGYGKNGALCVLQRSVRPQLITTFDLPGCFNMWSLSSSSGHHAYLLISQEESSLVLETGSEVTEMENTGFKTNEVTVYACNLGKNRYYTQVTVNGLHLLQNDAHIQFLPLESSDESIIFACSSDPYIALLTNTGQVYIAILKEAKNGGAKLLFLKSKLENNPEIVAISIYRDISGLFTDQIPNEFTDIPDNIRQQDVVNDVDDEEDLLYGENSAFEMPTLESSIYLNNCSSNNKKSRNCWWKRYLLDIKTSYWLFVVRDNMNLEIYSIPDLSLSYLIKEIGHGHQVLTDELESISSSSTINVYEFVSKSQTEVKEIRMVALGSHGSRPMLFVRITNNLFIYDTFRYAKGNIKIRFRKCSIPMIYSASTSDVIDTENTDFYAIQDKKCQIRYFSNITGYNGVFIAGAKPHWVFLTYRGELRTHPMYIDGNVSCFTSFNNLNCPHGFIYLNGTGQVRIGILPTHLNYDAPWPVRKVPLRATPHFVSYHVESKTYCLVTSVQEPSNQYYRFNGEDKELTYENRGPKFPFPLQDLFSVMLFSPIAWESVPNTKIDLEEWEHITCMKNVSLSYEGTTSGLRGYIVIGTNYNYGEDVTSRGRILIYDIIEVVPEPGQPLTKNKFKTLYAKEQKGPVTAVSQVLGFLVSAIGQKIYIWQLKDNDLVGVAFIDTQIYTHQILSIKSLILVADVYKSISLLRFQEEYRTLSLVSRDYKPCQVMGIEFLVDSTHLGFLVSDTEKNLILYMYQPKSRESYGGMKLLRKADFHLGQVVNSFLRIKCRTQNLVERRKQFLALETRHVTMFATLDGSIGCLLPVSERVYRRLLMLQNVLITFKPHTAGLNPKEFSEMPELHIIGQLLYAKKFYHQKLYCKWRLYMGKSWKVVSGETSGQTQVDSSVVETLSNWSYPIDIHVTTTGIDGWPKIYIEVYHLDFFGRSNISGFGFICLPATTGKHVIDCYTWKPYANLSEQICQYIFRHSVQLTNHEFICNPIDRFSLRTESAGIVRFHFEIVMKHFEKYAIEYK